MRSREKLWLVLGLAVSAVVILVGPGLADTVVTKEGTTIEGKIISGLPEVIALETTGGTLQIKREDLKGLERASQDIITTQDGSIYKGRITTELPEVLKLEVKTGIMEVKWTKIKRVNLGEIVGPERPRPTGQAVTLVGVVETKEGSQERGTIYGFPDSVQIETSAGALTLQKEVITEIVFGEPDLIKTQDKSLFRGEITTQMPEAIQVEKEAGMLSIPAENIKRITFTKKIIAEPPVPRPSGSGWNWEAFAVESAVGSIGAAGGGVAGALIGTALGCGTGDIQFCAIGLLIGTGAGVVGGATLSVRFVGSFFYNIQGNMMLATIFSIGGWIVIGQLPLPASGFIGAGVGAALGYNFGVLSKREESASALNITLALLEW